MKSGTGISEAKKIFSAANEFVETVSVITKSYVKTTRSIQNTLSLLKLPEEIQEAVKTGRIGVSQGYIFADNLGSPALLQIFNDALNKPMPNNTLKMAFVTAAQAGKAKTAKKPQPVQTLRNNIKSVGNIIEIQVSKLAPKEMTDLLADMESLTQLIRQGLDRQANEASRISAEKETAAMIKAAKKKCSCSKAGRNPGLAHQRHSIVKAGGHNVPEGTICRRFTALSS